MKEGKVTKPHAHTLTHWNSKQNKQQLNDESRCVAVAFRNERAKAHYTNTPLLQPQQQQQPSEQSTPAAADDRGAPFGIQFENQLSRVR